MFHWLLTFAGFWLTNLVALLCNKVWKISLFLSPAIVLKNSSIIVANRLERTKTNQSPMTYFCFSDGYSGKFETNPRSSRTFDDCDYKLGWRWFDQTRKTWLLFYQGVGLWPFDLKVGVRWLGVEPLTWWFLVPVLQHWAAGRIWERGSQSSFISSAAKFKLPKD